MLPATRTAQAEAVLRGATRVGEIRSEIDNLLKVPGARRRSAGDVGQGGHRLPCTKDIEGTDAVTRVWPAKG